MAGFWVWGQTPDTSWPSGYYSSPPVTTGIRALNLEISPWQVVWPRCVLIVGLSMIFAPLNVAAFLYIPRQLRPLLPWGFWHFCGTKEVQSVHPWHKPLQEPPGAISRPATPTNISILSTHPSTTPSSSKAKLFSSKERAIRPKLPGQMTLQVLQGARDRQASSLAYFDVFWFAAIVAGALILLLPLMRRSKAEKGAHIAAE